MFIGEYLHNLDDKNRMAVPVKFRVKLGKGAVVTKGLEHCLFLFNAADWEEFVQKIKNLPISQANNRAFSRLMLAGAMEVDLDNQGRILLPDYLKQYAGLKKQIVVAGLYNRVEIWDEEAWKNYKAKTEASSDEIAERLGEMGI